MFRKIKQATRNCGSKPYEKENDLTKRKTGSSGDFGKAESFLSEELSLSSDKTENTVSILSITVKNSARVIAKSSRVIYQCLEQEKCCQEP